MCDDTYAGCAVGRVELIIGPMFAGKTTELMRRVRREMHARRSCFVIKYANDTRYNHASVASHDKITLRACAAVRALAEVGTQWCNYDVVAIDEGQFFDDIVDFCGAAARRGKTVFVSALDGDYLCRPFGRICELVPLCEQVTKLTAVCMLCHTREASFTRRTVDSDERELIGGAEMYIATCRACYHAPGPLSSAVVRHVHETMRQVEQVCLGPYVHAAASTTTTTTTTMQNEHEREQSYSSSLQTSVDDVDQDVCTPCNSVISDGCQTPDGACASAAAAAAADMVVETATATTTTTTSPASDTSTGAAGGATSGERLSAPAAATTTTTEARATGTTATADKTRTTSSSGSTKRTRESALDEEASGLPAPLRTRRALMHDDDY